LDMHPEMKTTATSTTTQSPDSKFSHYPEGMVYTENFSSNGRPYTAVTFEFASLLTMVKNDDPRVNHLQKHHLKGQKRLVSYVGDKGNIIQRQKSCDPCLAKDLLC